MHDEQNGRSAALTELRRKLADGLVRAKLDKTRLATRAGLGRTTVSEAFSPRGPVPSEPTVDALARALKLPVEQMLELQRTAANGPGLADAGGPGPGRAIGKWEPHALEVHPAGPAPGTRRFGSAERRALSGYVSRAHDQVLAEAVTEAGQGSSRIVVLVGTSSTGKTRACWEAVQPLAKMGWRLWHPFDPTRAEAALEDLHRVGPRTVVWLNEAQHYLGDRAVGERIAAAVHRLLLSPTRGPVLVLGTLWPDYARQYTALPTPGGEDPHTQVRELLSGHILAVPETFDAAALAVAAVLAENGDRLLADALTRARDGGRVTQDLAGAPELLNSYEHATPAAKALLEAAMDARRLGVGLHLPQAFLTDAAPDYLNDTDWNQLTDDWDDWAEEAYAELAQQVHGKHAPLSRVTPRRQRRPPGPCAPADAASPRLAGLVFHLADYLEQYGRTTRRHLCPPASFWHAAHTHLTRPDDLDNLTRAAEARHRLQWAHHLQLRAADHGSTEVLAYLARKRDDAGDREGAEAMARQAAEHGDTDALTLLAELREWAGDRESAETLFREAAAHGNTDALSGLAQMREKAGDREGAEAVARQAAEHGNTDALVGLAQMREEAGDQEGAEAVAREAAAHGNTNALNYLARIRALDGDLEGAEAMAWQGAEHCDTDALSSLAQLREEAGDRESAEAMARQAAAHGNSNALNYLAQMREEAGDRESAETLYRQAAAHGNTDALTSLTQMREKAGDRESAEAMARQAAAHGNTDALNYLAQMREKAGNRESAEAMARQAAEHGNTDALVGLAQMRATARDRGSAETLYREATDHGDTRALTSLAQMREKAGDRESAEAMARQAAEHGSTDALVCLAEMREEAGDRGSAETLYRQAADHGKTRAVARAAAVWEEGGNQALAGQSADHSKSPLMYFLRMKEAFKRLWPYGLDPDGTPTPPWQ